MGVFLFAGQGVRQKGIKPADHTMHAGKGYGDLDNVNQEGCTVV